MKPPLRPSLSSFAVACIYVTLLCGLSPGVRADLSVGISYVPAPTDQIVLTWPTVPGRTYALWTATALSAGWSPSTATPTPLTASSESLRLAFQREAGPAFFRVAETRSPYGPDWDGAAALRTIRFTNNPAATPSVNGARLRTALLGLVPGDRLEIESGTYSLDSYTALDLQGTAAAPIWITAAPGASVRITRPDANQNIVNVGAGSEARYLCFRGLEFTGGSHGIRLHGGTQVWIDQCRVHDTGDVGISANSRDTSYLFLTRNEIWNTGGTGEGMYLGGNNGSVTMSRSVIAQNHVHDTINGVTQGDGIEVKQGSWGNWIVENHVHDCNYPCILVYGTAGQPPNIVERNLCYRSNDNTLQVQGEAIVRNNLIFAGAAQAFASQPHQGNPTALTVVNNTFVNAGTAVRLASWGLGTNMVFANNACYSQNAAALNAVSGFGTTTFAGNVGLGSVTSGITGFTTAAGIADFTDVAWDGSRRDARPSATSKLRGAANAAFAPPADFSGAPRSAPHTAGGYQASPP